MMTPENHPQPDQDRLNSTERVSPKTIGTIIHRAYGISLDGQPASPASYQELQLEGYSDKEIDAALKAGLLVDTMNQLAEVIATREFIPASVEWEGYAGTKTYAIEKREDLVVGGRPDYAKLKLYVKSLVGGTANQVFSTSYKENHPNAFAMLRRFEGLQEDDEADMNVSPLWI